MPLTSISAIAALFASAMTVATHSARPWILARKLSLYSVSIGCSLRTISDLKLSAKQGTAPR